MWLWHLPDSQSSLFKAVISPRDAAMFLHTRARTPGCAEQEDVMSLHPIFGEANWSRRRLVSALAALAASTSVDLLGSAAWAQTPAWKEYRNNDMGFRVEMPGEPKVEEQTGDPSDPFVRSIELRLSSMT